MHGAVSPKWVLGLVRTLDSLHEIVKLGTRVDKVAEVLSSAASLNAAAKLSVAKAARRITEKNRIAFVGRKISIFTVALVVMEDVSRNATAC